MAEQVLFFPQVDSLPKRLRGGKVSDPSRNDSLTGISVRLLAGKCIVLSVIMSSKKLLIRKHTSTSGSCVITKGTKRCTGGGGNPKKLKEM